MIPARKAADQRARMATICVGLVGAQDQRRHQADHAVGGDAEQQPGLGGALQQITPQGRSSSMPIISPWPRISTTPATPGQLALQPAAGARRPRPRWPAGRLLP
jgi:hypothetical protein